MNNTIFRYKILFILSILLLVSCIFISNNSFAFNFTYDNEKYDLGDLPFSTTEHPDFLVLKFTNGKGYQVLFPASNYDLPFYRTGGDGIQYYTKGTTTYGQWNYYEYTISTNSWSSMKTTSQREAKIYSNGSHVADIIYCTHDVILKSDGTIFFQSPPSLLVVELQKAEVMKGFKNLMKKLVVSLLVFLIGLIGLRKAWSFLKTVLHKA